ncbi:type 4a pilus biogenesis protein PilO [Geobacter sp.]|uniref:type 4a pilus biogenesis protein PilO n=1 Tax=Geobacter sp. TaxID=46610 RepID=UPI002626A5E1|nr:type 4a pilus biogenesis protein PilO [Geobacter sp.]
MTKQQLLELCRSRPKTLLLLLLLLLLNVGLAVYVQTVQGPRIVRLEGDWTAKRMLGAGGKGDIAAIYRQGLADLAKFQETAPLKRDFAREIMEIFETASNNGLKVVSITYKPEVSKESGFVVYGITLDLTGKYAGVKSFVSDMQCQHALVTIDSLQLSSGSAAEEAVGLKLGLSAYLRAEAR